jgi:Zn-dependent peptidase ImmA (M78 family)
MDYKTKAGLDADDFRSIHGLGRKDPLDIHWLLDSLNVPVVFKPLSQGFSGLAGKAEDLSFILINSWHTLGRQNFTIAHELYHLYFDKSFENMHIDLSIEGSGTGSSLGEKQANAFASALLLPPGFLEIIPEQERKKNSLSVPTLVRIEQFYRCSRSALLYRLKEFHLADESFIAKHENGASAQAKMLGYDTSLYRPGRDGLVIGNYTSLALRLYEHELISETSLAQYLQDIGLDPEELQIEQKE